MYARIETGVDYDIVSCAAHVELRDLCRAWHVNNTNRWPTRLEEVSNDGNVKHVRIHSKFHCTSD